MTASSAMPSAMPLAIPSTMPSATAPGGLEALLAAGESALAQDGDLLAARRCFEPAHRIAEQAGDAHAMAVAALGLGGLWVHEHRTAAGSAQLRDRLVKALAAADPHSSDALRLRIRLAGESDYRAGAHTEILALLDEARAAADPPALAEALSIAHHCLLGPQHAGLRAGLAEDLIAESFRTGRRSDLLMGLLWHSADLILAGDPHAGRGLTELRGLLARREHPAVGFAVSAIDVMLAVRAGELERAERLADACAEHGEAAGDVDAVGWRLGQLVAIRWYQGRLPELLPLLDGLAGSTDFSAVDASRLSALAVCAAMSGDRRKAAGALAALRGRELAGLPRSSTWLPSMYGVVEAAHLLQDTAASREAYRLLQPFAELPMTASVGVMCFGSVHHALGVASLTEGDARRAVTHLSAAVQRNLALGHWPALVCSRLRLAQALALRGGPGDAQAARLESATAAREAAAFGPADPDRGAAAAGATGAAGPGTGANPAAAAAITAVCVREGRHWRIDLGQRSTRVPHNVGMLHLAVLLANPGREIAATDLAAGPAAFSAAGGGPAASAQPVLDRAAVQDYRRRLERLRAEIDELEAGGEPGRAAGRRTERDWLAAELGRAAGIGGRTRGFPDDAERARVAVGKAIRRAIDRVAAADPLIGGYLRSTVHTGLRCCHRPL